LGRIKNKKETKRQTYLKGRKEAKRKGKGNGLHPYPPINPKPKNPQKTETKI